MTIKLSYAIISAFTLFIFWAFATSGNNQKIIKQKQVIVANDTTLTDLQKVEKQLLISDTTIDFIEETMYDAVILKEENKRLKKRIKLMVDTLNGIKHTLAKQAKSNQLKSSKKDSMVISVSRDTIL